MIAIVQPLVAHYRQDFFIGMENEIPIDIYCYDEKTINKNNLSKSNVDTKKLKNYSFRAFLLYNPIILLRGNYIYLVLPLHFGHITTWFLLFTQFIHGKKIILWGHGISVKRYLQEEKNPSLLLKIMIKMAFGCWFYTKNELNIWKRTIPRLNAVALSNTISGIEEIGSFHNYRKSDLKDKYGIFQKRILIFAARFNSANRRTDILVKAIETLNEKEFGFIIIGNGGLKPDFSMYKNVYDFGGLYDLTIKSELFFIADIYFQPGWLGLSAVEAMAFGKPIFTFERSTAFKQGVEYGYIIHNENGLVFKDYDQLIERIQNISDYDLARLGLNAKKFANLSLTNKNMVANALSLIN